MPDPARIPVEQLLDLYASPLDWTQDVLDEVERYRVLTLSSSWRLLLRHADVLDGLADTALHMIRFRHEMADPARERFAWNDKFMKSVFQNLRDDSTSDGETVRQALLDKFTQELGDPVAAETRLQALLNGEGPFFEQARNFSSRFDKFENILVERFVSLSTLALGARWKALFYLSKSGTSSYLDTLGTDLDNFPGISLSSGDLDLLSKHSNRLRDLNDTSLALIYDALAKDAASGELRGLAHRAIRESTLIVSSSAAVHGAFTSMADREPDPTAWTLQMQASLQLTEMRRRAAVLQAYAAIIIANLESRDANRWLSIEKQRTASRALSTGVDRGLPLSLTQVLQDSSLDPGTLVAVEGEITDLHIEDDPLPPKFSSFLSLSDRVTGLVVPVRAHMFSLSNNGVVNGAYCSLSGFLRRDEPWLSGGGVGLDIDRLSLSTLRKEHWLDDVSYRMRPYYRLYLDEMSMFFTQADNVV